ncbi:14431_t:CDS:2 [Cetraspora pellucida]|uniref:14431_t:CDS:1 n=1 Tax=Cetraspora pellucida TaxID=1433469 RepID=A0ACA9KYX7_9GLOM|nr:14431_t:CDS:2 [Cetraspora pellucida]
MSDNDLNLGIRLLFLVIADFITWFLLVRIRLYVSTSTSSNHKDSKLTFLSVSETVKQKDLTTV